MGAGLKRKRGHTRQGVARVASSINIVPAREGSGAAMAPGLTPASSVNKLCGDAAWHRCKCRVEVGGRRSGNVMVASLA